MRSIVKKLFIIFMLFSILVINVVSLRCENKSDSTQAQSRAQLAEKRVEKKYDPEQQDEKSYKYEKWEWLIKQSLMDRYKRLDVQNLEDSLD